MKHVLIYTANLAIYLQICKSNRRIDYIYRRTAKGIKIPQMGAALALLARFLRPMKNTSRGAWGHGNECPHKKSVPTFGLRGGLGGVEWRPPIRNKQKRLEKRLLPLSRKASVRVALWCVGVKKHASRDINDQGFFVALAEKKCAP